MQKRRKIPGVKNGISLMNDRIPFPLLLYDNRSLIVIRIPLHTHPGEYDTHRRTVLGLLTDDKIGIVTRLETLDIQIRGLNMDCISFLCERPKCQQNKKNQTWYILHGYSCFVTRKYAGNSASQPGLFNERHPFLNH
jgi:hypothetical protein